MQQEVENTATLKGKKVVLLGGSSGIGFATAKALAAKGAQVIIVSSNQGRIDNALKELPSNSEGYAVDLTDESAIKNFFAHTGKFDHLVYTAGENIKLNTLENTALEEARDYFNLRYWGAFAAVKYASPYIKTNGSITLTSGIASNRPNKGWSLGASICAAMEGFTRAMAMELAPVRVNVVSPGVVKTNLWNSMNNTDRENMYYQLSESLPVKRIGEPEDTALSYVYLICQQYVTGQTLIVDGGASFV